MCGRITLNTNLALAAEQFRVEYIDQQLATLVEGRYNVPPTLDIPIVRQQPESSKRELVSARWGLLPSWTKDPKKAPLLNNARAETVAEKPSFRTAFKKRRCIVPVSGFYEWVYDSKPRLPFYFHPTKAPLFGFAGLWEPWNDIVTCTIITTDPNSVMEPVHDRMPVILGANDYETWLDPDASDLQHLLAPCPADEVACYPVDPFVNNVRKQGAKCIEPLAHSAS